MLFGRKQARYEYVAEESVIRLKAGCAGAVDHVEIRTSGDRIYYRGASRTHFLTFEIADYDGHADSRKHGLPSADRLRAYADQDLAALAQVTGVPLADLRQIRDLEKNSRVPPPTWQ
ncbi:MAG: hypothetical protein ABIL09_15120 [Gemmatimonadota bacterium]